MEQRIRYTVIWERAHWWSARETLTLIGKASSKKENEVLIFTEDGGFQSINYNRVVRVIATPLDPPHTHESGEAHSH